MQIQSFEYHKSTKTGIEVSNRTAIILHPAKDYHHTVDISDVEMPMALEILAAELEQLNSEYNIKLKQLLTEFGLESKIRNFKTERMSNVETKEI